MTNRMCLQTLPLLKSGQLHEGCMPMDTLYTLPAVHRLTTIGGRFQSTPPSANACLTVVRPAPVAPKTSNSSLAPSEPVGGLELRSMTNMRCPEPAAGTAQSAVTKHRALDMIYRCTDVAFIQSYIMPHLAAPAGFFPAPSAMPALCTRRFSRLRLRVCLALPSSACLLLCLRDKARGVQSGGS